jgi:hypothetical protein
VGDRSSTYFRLVLDLRITLSFSCVHIVENRVVMVFLEDKKYLGREDYNVSIFLFPCFVVRGDFMSL